MDGFVGIRGHRFERHSDGLVGLADQSEADPSSTGTATS